MVATRGVPYRKVRTLVFTPSVDIAKIAAKHIRALARSNRVVRLIDAVMSGARDWKRETDWASYLLFDGEYAGSLIELGRADARARAREIRRFFGEREL
jgi:NTE family protein